MTIKELRSKTEMNRTQFAEYFGIPYRTVEDWETDKRKCSDYLIRLMCYRLATEKKINLEENSNR